MDNILRKNIFLDEDLRKLAPDYTPNDITFRMQVRRAMFKDIHNHNFLKINNCHSKSIKKMKDGYKISKEIVKIRNDFRNINLRNQLIMKSDLKEITQKSEIINYDRKLLLNDIKIFNDDTDHCEQDLEGDMAKLVLCNNSDFKINTKLRAENVHTNNNLFISNKSKNHAFIRKTDKFEKSDQINDEDVEQPMVIECAFTYKSPEIPESVQIIESIEDHEKLKEDSNNITDHTTPGEINDLQRLLIMMAITKSNKDYEAPSLQNPDGQSNNIINDLETINNRVAIEPEKGDITESLHIIPLRLEMSERQSYIVKKYITRWRKHISKRKEHLKKQREETLNNFFDKLSKKKDSLQSTPDHTNKAKWFAQDYNTYQHRYRVQKHIIALQKAKLEEQNRVIEELKYNRIVEASRDSVDAVKEQVRKTYYDIDRQLKPKLKCLSNELKLKEFEEPSLVLQCLKVPKFLQRMEKRAREREEKHALIRERRIQMEEERIRLKQQAELAKAEMDKEEKMRRIKELRDKRRKEKVETIRKKQYAARLRALIVMADLYHEKCLMAKYGIQPFKILLQIKRDNMIKAKLHFDFQLKKNVFLNWMWYTEDMLYERNYIAEDFHRKKLLRKYFNGFKQNVRSYIIKKQVADDYYDLYVMQLVFRKFLEALAIVRKENEMKWQIAVLYYNSNIKFKVFTCWRTLPALNALKREQEARKARWREKVLMVVPDYTPPDD